MNQDAVEDIADIIAGVEEDPDTNSLFYQFKQVLSIHDVPDDEKIDTIVAGVEHHFDRLKQKTVSDLRESLEAVQL